MAIAIERRAPGVHLEQVTTPAAPTLETGVPVFLGRLSREGERRAPFAGANGAGATVPIDYATWAGLEELDRIEGTQWWARGGYLGFAVRGFFENGGRRCHLARIAEGGFEGALPALEALDDFDLVAAPDVAGSIAEQGWLLDLCVRRGRCFALLDGPGQNVMDPGFGDAALVAAVEAIRGSALREACVNGALYGPWIKVRGACFSCAGAGCPTCGGTGQGFVPPSGHMAGVVARTDRRIGVHKAPANEPIEGAIQVQLDLDEASLAALNGAGVNCIRALPGRGIRAWGARTLVPDDPDFAYVNPRRMLLTVARWLEVAMADAAFEPNEPLLWMRLDRQVTAFLDDLSRRGALAGASGGDAFYVKCDAETNPPDVRDRGQVTIEVGLALARPGELVTVRLVAGAGGVRVEGDAPRPLDSIDD